MQLTKVFRGMLIALPVVTMMACTSSDENQISEAEANRIATEQAEAERRAQEQAEQSAAAERAQRLQAEQEQRKRDMETLKEQQTVYFDFDRSNIKTEFYSILDQHANYLIANPGQSLVIEGHCDSRGTPEYNIALGERRAKSVETYLLNAGVSASQVTVVSYGEEKPAVMGSTEAAFSKNRRGVLVYQ